MAEVEKLRSLLAEARSTLNEHERYCLNGFCELCELAKRIDAALAATPLPEGYGPCEFCKGSGTAPMKAAWSPRDVLGGGDGE